MTPADRDSLIARAKRLATPVVSSVAANIRPDHLIGDASREQLAALVVVLAEAADLVKLRAVVEATEDGPDLTDRDVLLRAAHAHAIALRRLGEPVPARVRMMDNEYRAVRKQARETVAKGVAGDAAA